MKTHTIRQRGKDRGSTAVEWAIATPLLIMLLAALGYGFVWANASYAARAAAQDAVQTTRVIGGNPAAGQSEACTRMSSLAGRARDIQVSVTRGPDTTTAIVSAIVPTPFGGLPVAHTTSASTERWTP
jgi:Flp pilus assembly protein TadG